MKRLIFILFLIPLLSTGQFVPFGFMEETVSGSSNLYTNSDAANPVSEANSAAGWTDDIGTGMSISVNSSDTTDGSYSLQFDHDGSASTQYTMTVDITGLTNGGTYLIEWDGKEIAGQVWEVWLRASQGWTASSGTGLVDGAINTWDTNQSLTGTTNSTTASIRVGTTAAGQPAHQALMDNFRVTEQ